ncbi:chemotaxis protein CheB [Sphingomonas sp. ZB1N12]
MRCGGRSDAESRPGRIIIAPGDAHLKAVKLSEGGAAFLLAHEAVASGCMPSVDPMMASFADVYGPRLLAVVLSGMGPDGAGRVRGACTKVAATSSCRIGKARWCGYAEGDRLLGHRRRGVGPERDR